MCSRVWGHFGNGCLIGLMLFHFVKLTICPIPYGVAVDTNILEKYCILFTKRKDQLSGIVICINFYSPLMFILVDGSYLLLGFYDLIWDVQSGFLDFALHEY